MGKLVSIMIVTHFKDKNFLNALESIIKYTSIPYELIIEDDIDGKGFINSFNLGFKRAKGDYIISFHDDAEVVKEGWLEKFIEAAEKSENIGIVSTNIGTAFNEYLYFSGGCTLIKKEVFDNVGYFDERFILGCSEDLDFSIRAQKFGYKVVKINMQGQEYMVEERDKSKRKILNDDTYILHQGSYAFKKRYTPDGMMKLKKTGLERLKNKWKEFGVFI